MPKVFNYIMNLVKNTSPADAAFYIIITNYVIQKMQWSKIAILVDWGTTNILV